MRWASTPMDRTQVLLFYPTLEAMIPEDHPVRLFDEILNVCDWSSWEGEYCLVAGQPPIHPKPLAAVILYGLSLRIRSSRVLERMCTNSIDFMWLVYGRRIDHSTFCKFRTRFRQQLKTLFRDLFRVAMSLGLAHLNTVALDGTRVRANSSRYATASAETIEACLVELDGQVEQMLRESENADVAEGDLFGEGSANQLPGKLANAQRRQERLAKALAAAKKKDAADSGAKTKSPRGCAVPVADPDSTVQPDKDGGYAPNYTPVVTAEGHGGFIADTEVLAGPEQPDQAVAAVDRVAANFEEEPNRLLGDSAYDSGETLAELSSRDVEPFIPLQQRPNPADNPAWREDLTQPVGETDWPKLPQNVKTKKLDRSAFVYDTSSDCYYCPMGRKLSFWYVQNKPRRTGSVAYRVYRCECCEGCELRAQCVSSKAGHRTVSRDEYERHREAMDARLGTSQGRKLYGRRKWIGETPFAVLKDLLGLRQFLLRGLEKVKAEWLWACTAFNLSKLVREVSRIRTNLATLIG